VNRSISCSDVFCLLFASLLVLFVTIILLFRHDLFGSSFRAQPDADSLARLHRIEAE
jgi:hypothetical protein